MATSPFFILQGMTFFSRLPAASAACLTARKVAANTHSQPPDAEQYSTGMLVRRLLTLAWQFRANCVWSIALSLVLLLLGIAGLQLLGLAIDVIRQGLDPSLPKPLYPFGWQPPDGWTPLRGRMSSSLGDAAAAVALLPCWC